MQVVDVIRDLLGWAWHLTLRVLESLVVRRLDQALSSQRPVVHNLAGEKPRLIGRDRELQRLRRQLSPSSESAVIVLWGTGGVGKTYLALAIAHEHLRRAGSRWERLRDRLRVRPLGFFDAIVHVSAEGGHPSPAGPIRRSPVKGLPDITSEIARVLGDRELLTLSPSERANSLIQALTRLRVLLIMDNLEAMDSEVLNFVRRVPTPTRVVITSRRSVDGFRHLPLGMLDPASARRLIRREAEEKGLHLQRDQVENLYQATNGLPLAIWLSVGRLAHGVSALTIVDELRRGEGDLAEHVVDLSVRALSPENEPAWRMFRALALFEYESGAHREALGATADLRDGRQRDAGIADLVRWSLVVQEGGDRFRFCHPLIHARAGRLLDEDPEAPAFRQRWIAWYQDRLAERPQNISLLHAERINLIRILETLRQENRMEDLARCLWDAAILLDEGPVEPYLESLRWLFRWTLAQKRGDLLHGLTWEIIVRGGPLWEKEFTEQWWGPLRSLLNNGVRGVTQTDVIQARLAYRKAQRGEICREEARLVMERTFRALVPDRSEVEAEEAISICNSLGFFLMERRLGEPPDYEAAREWLGRGLDLLRQHGSRLRDPKDWEAVLRGNMALLVARADKRYAEAMQILQGIRHDLRWKRNLAEWYVVMTVYAFHVCRIREARRYKRDGEVLLLELGRESLDTDEAEEWARIRPRLNRPFGWIFEWFRCMATRVRFRSPLWPEAEGGKTWRGSVNGGGP